MKTIRFLAVILFITTMALSAQQQQVRHYRWENIPNLTDDQKAKLEKLQNDHLKKMTDLRNSLAEKRAQLRTAMTGTTADEKKALQLAKDINEIQATMQEERIKHQFAIANLLTDEQKTWWFSSMPQGPNCPKGNKRIHSWNGPYHNPNCPYYQD
jgi:Spy/CpxP family protein refolding chaperone